MDRKGFDNEKYLKEQSQAILERVEKFGNKPSTTTATWKFSPFFKNILEKITGAESMYKSLHNTFSYLKLRQN